MTDRMEKTAGTEKLQTTSMVRSRLKSADALKQIKEATLAQIGHRFDADVESGAKLYLMVCGGGGCHSSASGKLIARLTALAARDGMQEEIAVERTGCFGLCSEGPILVVQPEGTMYTKVSEDDIDEIWESHVKNGKIVERLLSPHEAEFFSKQNRIALKNCGRSNPERIEEYIALDGYAALAKALYEMEPEDVIEIIKASGLRGRGGGGFPAGTKWEVAAQQQTEEKLSGSVSTNGSTSMEKVIGALSEQFMADNSGMSVTYDPTGSGAGIEAASNGSADIGLASRALKDEEKAGGLTETVVALDGIAVIVNADSKVEDLSVEQIAKIFTGEITDWSEVGGEAGKISCIGREAGSGTRDGFESITGTKDACKLDQELTSTGGVIEAVAGNANAIGYASLSAVEGKDTVKAVTVGGVACTEETVLDGSYAIQRPFVLVTKTDAPLSTAAQAFFDYATSTAANDLIKAAGAVPVAK